MALIDFEKILPGKSKKKQPVFINIFDLSNEDQKVSYEDLINSDTLIILEHKMNFTQKGSYVVYLKYTFESA